MQLRIATIIDWEIFMIKIIYIEKYFVTCN